MTQITSVAPPIVERFPEVPTLRSALQCLVRIWRVAYNPNLGTEDIINSLVLVIVVLEASANGE